MVEGVRAVEVALNVLEAVAFAESEIGVSEVAARLRMAKGAVHRHLRTLTDRGYLVQSPTTARYQIGVKFQLLGRVGAQENGFFAASEAVMAQLRDAVGESVVLSGVENHGMRVLATLPGRALVEIGVRAGSLLSFDRSAQGRVMLAFVSDERREAFKRTLPPARRAALERDLVRAQRQGWLASPGEVMRGINAIAAPVFDASDTCVGTIATVGVFEVPPRGRIVSMISQLQAAANRISVNLGRRAGEGTDLIRLRRGARSSAPRGDQVA
ncbi:MAG: IclR family transcriptional regulator [Xanthobacteraceae bacterium]